MTRLLLRLPLLVVLAFIGALSMFVPAIHASILDDHLTARVFFYFALLFLFLTAGFALATANHVPRHPARSHLLALVGVFLALPLMLAAPVREVVRDTSFLNAWVEMVSSLTTTGATLFPDVERLPITLHLWRAMVGWMGGMLMWIAAAAILAPLRLGGFEVVLPPRTGIGAARLGWEQPLDPGARLLRVTGQLAPLYIALTLVLWALIYVAGEDPTHAAIHAMSTMSTSGITALEGPVAGQGGRMAELAMFVFLIFAISRQTFASDLHKAHVVALIQDRELRIAAAAVVFIPSVLFLRHWFGALDVDDVNDGAAAIGALWGAAFTVLSFLTTTGFESADWAGARAWSGLGTPGILLLGLAMFGGGVATTAGGVKLLRVYTLYRHGRREMDLLVHPSSVAGSAHGARRITADGVQAAWVFFMLFAISISGTAILFAIAGLDFETALILTTASLSTTGPLTAHAGSEAIALAQLSPFAKGIFCAAMVLGRLETLAIIALFNPEFWR